MFSDEVIFKILQSVQKAKAISESLQGTDKLSTAKFFALTEFLKKAEQDILTNVPPDTYQNLILMNKDADGTWKANMYSSLTKRMADETDPTKKASYKEILDKYFPEK